MSCLESVAPESHTSSPPFESAAQAPAVGDNGAIPPAALAAMRGCPLFFGLNREMLEAIAHVGKLCTFAPEEPIIFAGERSHSMFIVCSGAVSCQIDDVEVKQLRTGSSFGDMAIYCDFMYRLHEEHSSIAESAGALEQLLTRTADIVGLEHGILMELCAQDLSPFFSISPRLVCNIVQVGEAQLNEACNNKSFQALEARRIIQSLHPLVKAGFMSGVPDDQVGAILDSISTLTTRHVRRSETLVAQGSDGNSLFLVTNGLFSCQVNGKAVRYFGPYQTIGEVSLCASFPELLLKSMPDGTQCDRITQSLAACTVRTADVKCVEEGDVIEIPAGQMTEAFRISHQVFLNIFRLAQARFQEAIRAGSVDAILRYQT